MRPSGIQLFLILIASTMLSACATTSGQAGGRDAAMHEYAEKITAARDRGEITSLQRSQLLANAHQQLYGKSTLADEYYKYQAYLAVEHDSGRMTLQQMDYLLAQKKNELGRQEFMMVAPFLLQEQQQPPRPVVPPIKVPPTYNTNCTSNQFGTNCTTRQGY